MLKVLIVLLMSVASFSLDSDLPQTKCDALDQQLLVKENKSSVSIVKGSIIYVNEQGKTIILRDILDPNITKELGKIEDPETIKKLSEIKTIY